MVNVREYNSPIQRKNILIFLKLIKKISIQAEIYNLKEKYSQCGDKNRAKRPKNFYITDTRDGNIRL
jgi:hypothetical protein